MSPAPVILYHPDKLKLLHKVYPVNHARHYSIPAKEACLPEVHRVIFFRNLHYLIEVEDWRQQDLNKGLVSGQAGNIM